MKTTVTWWTNAAVNSCWPELCNKLPLLGH